MRIRASALPSWNDCPRRTAAKSFRREIEERGFELHRPPPSIGAAVGTTTHHAWAGGMRAKISNPELTVNELHELVPSLTTNALEKFRLEISDGVTWDEHTPNTRVATEQIERMTRASLTLVHDRRPLLVEHSMEASIGNGWILTGTLDMFDADGNLEDLKTGSLVRPYQAQLGAYALLLKSEGHEVLSASISFVRRTRLGKPQEKPQRTTYDVGVSERYAWATAQRAKREMIEFMETANPEALPANPMTMMCTKLYCPAWGTSFCRLAAERAPTDPNSSAETKP